MGRLISEQKIPTTLYPFSRTTYRYLADTDQVLEERTANYFSWLLLYKDGKKSLEVRRDTTGGTVTQYVYDDEQRVVRQTTYLSYPALDRDYFGTHYTYSDDRPVEEQVLDESERVISPGDKTRYRYDAQGLPPPLPRPFPQ